MSLVIRSFLGSRGSRAREVSVPGQKEAGTETFLGDVIGNLPVFEVFGFCTGGLLVILASRPPRLKGAGLWGCGSRCLGFGVFGSGFRV